jgi:hypothetical protein
MGKKKTERNGGPLDSAPCPVCGKIGYRSRAIAKQELRKQQTKGVGVKSYYKDEMCDPPYQWHLTSQPSIVQKTWRKHTNDYPI